MKKIIPILFMAFSVFACKSTPKVMTVEELPAELAKLDGVVSVEAVPFDTLALPFVKAKYVVMIEQRLNPEDTSSQKFQQRFTLLHSDFSKPMIFQTEGYSGAYALKDKYAAELTKHYEANEVVVEHRFFEKSRPDSIQWEYMRGPYAAADLHKINKELRKIYKNKFITTGISKGGQTTMFYKTYYPEDADISVPYVGPLCFGVEDGRHEPFLANVCGTQVQRDSIIAFQREVLKRRPAMVKMLDQYSKDNNLQYRVVNSNELLDYCVLELSFSMWQWGTPASSLPSLKVSDKEIFGALVSNSGPEYYSINPGEAFNVQALAELGYYGYDTTPFKDLLVVKDTHDYMRNIFVPLEVKDTPFDVTQANKIVSYLDANDPKMLFIYGEFDPWTAPAPHDSLFEGKANLKKYMQPGGSHRARIDNMPDSLKNEIYATLDKWLAE